MRILENSYTVPEKIFVQKLDELIHSKTIDTYRNRIHNPKSVLVELKSVINGIKKGTIKNDDHIKYVAKEANELLTDQCGLKFNRISLKLFKKLLSGVNKENWDDILHCINVCLYENENYCSELFENLINEINEVNKDYERYKESKKEGRTSGWSAVRISKWTNYLVTEIVFIGYSKSRLRQINYKYLIASRKSFIESFQGFREIITGESLDTIVLLKAKIPSAILTKICSSYENISIVNQGEFTQVEIVKFIKSKPQFDCCLRIRVKAFDFHKAAYSARNTIASILDFINLGHRDSKSDYYHHCMVIDENNGDYGQIDSNHVLDGIYRSDDDLHSVIDEKFQKIVADTSIDENVVSVLKSGVRYLRLGDEDIEAEQKLLNYWIGIEHIFATPNKEVRLIKKIAKHFSQIHFLSFYKRNIENLHSTIIRLKLNEKLPSFSGDSLEYLINEDTYVNLINLCEEENPLMSDRAFKFKKTLSDNKILQNSLKKHIQDLEGNIYRIYRVRNEIVHNAAIKNNISELTSHLQYYLIFMLSSIMDFFTSDVVDINNDNKISIEDYFITYRLQYESLERDSVGLIEMMKYENPLSAHLEV